MEPIVSVDDPDVVMEVGLKLAVDPKVGRWH